MCSQFKPMKIVVCLQLWEYLLSQIAINQELLIINLNFMDYRDTILVSIKMYNLYNCNVYIDAQMLI